MNSLRKVAARGTVIALSGQAFRLVLQFGSMMILARQLSPAEFGLVGAIVVVVGLADIFRDFGLSSAAVQAKTLSTGQRDNLFWVNTAIGILLAALLALAAPLVALAFQMPALTELVPLMALSFVFTGIATQYRASLNRDLRFGALTVTEILAQVVSVAVAIFMVFNGFGVWSLVWMNVSLAAAGCIGMVIAGRWLPRWWHSGEQMRPLLTFGGDLVWSQTLGYVGNNFDKYLVGAQLGKVPLGLYERGMKLVNMPLTQLRSPLTSLALPLLSKMQDDDRRFSAAIVRGQVGLGYTIVAGLTIVIAGADPLVSIVLGGEFAQTAPIVQAIAAAGAATTISYVAYWVFVSRNLTRKLSHWTLGTTIVRIVACVAALPFGVLAVAWAAALVPIVAAPLSLAWLGSLTKLAHRTLLWSFVRISAVAAVASVVGFVVERSLSTNPFVELIAVAAACTGVYLAALVFPMYRVDARSLLDTVQAIRSLRSKTA